MSANISLDVLVQAVEALLIAKTKLTSAERNMPDGAKIINAWCRLSWRVEEITAAQRVEVTT